MGLATLAFLVFREWLSVEWRVSNGSVFGGRDTGCCAGWRGTGTLLLTFAFAPALALHRQIAQLFHSARDGQTIESAAVRWAKRGCVFQAQVICGLGEILLPDVLERLPLVRVDRVAGLPGFCRGRTAVSPRAADRVGQLAGMLYVFTRPTQRMAFSDGVQAGVGFQGAVAAFQGAVGLDCPLHLICAMANKPSR